MSFNFKVPLLYSMVFNDEPKSIEDYCAMIDKPLLVKFCRLLLNPFNNQYENPNSFLSNFFSIKNCEFVNQTAKIIAVYEQENNVQLFIVAKHKILELLEIVLSLNNNSNTTKLEDSEIEIIFFKLILLLNNRIEEKSSISLTSTEHIEGSRRWISAFSTHAFAYSDIENRDLEVAMISQIYKSQLLFEFLEQQQEWKFLIEDFLEKFSIKNWREYFSNIIYAFLCIWVDSKNKDIIGFKVPEGEGSSGLIQFYEYFCIPSDTSKYISRDLSLLKQYPLKKEGNRHFSILSFDFLVDLIHRSVYFKLNEISKKHKGKKTNFRSFYCGEFSENTLLYSVLDNIYQERYITFTGKLLKESFKIEAEPDYYVRNGNKILLFENKDVLLDADKKLSSDFAIIE